MGEGINVPLPDDLQELLVELSECQGIVNDSEYTPQQRDSLSMLREAGLVNLAWVITPSGKKRVKGA